MPSLFTKRPIGKRHFIAAAFVLCCSVLTAQIDTAFWFAVPRLTHDHAGRPIKLCVSTFGEAADITVTMPAATNPNIATFHVNANSSHVHQLVGGGQNASTGFNELSNIADYECNHNAISNKGIYIHSTAKIIAYISVMCNNSEIYALKGKNGLGKNFFIPMQYSYDVGDYNESRNSVEVIATEDNTTVQITPSKNLYGGQQAGVTFSKTLNRGQVFSFASASRAANQHLEGSIVTSNKPIVVDVSDDSATPNNANQDLVADQIVPVEMAGDQYIVIPSPTAANNTYNGSLSDHAYIFALENSTNVQVYKGGNFNPVASYNMNSGDKKDYHFNDTVPIYINADKPIFVFQVTGAGNELGGTLLPHIYCTGSKSVTYQPMPSYHGHNKTIYLNLICKQNITDDFQITTGNQPVNIAQSEWKDVFTYKYCRKKINNTSSVIKVSNPSGKFHMGVTDWNGNYDDCSISYFSDYNSGIELKWDTLSTHSQYCQGDTIKFKFDTVGTIIKRIEGPDNFELQGTDILQLFDVTPAHSGVYVVHGNDAEGCLSENFTDTIHITVNPIVETVVQDTVCYGFPYEEQGFNIPSDSTTKVGIRRDTITLQHSVTGCDSIVIMELTVRDSITSEFDMAYCSQYEWNGQLYTHTGDFRQKLTSVDGCDSTVTMHLTIIEPYVSINSSSHDFCDDESTTLTAISDFNKYLWSTGDTTESIFVEQPGMYKVTVTDETGLCQATSFYEIPACTFNMMLPTAITPSRQDGNNDRLFLPQEIHKYIKDFHIEIYNRWGTCVFKSDDKNFSWDGSSVKYKKDDTKDGSYNYAGRIFIYVINYTNLDGKKFVKRGEIMVL
ncbi:MAG: gliding motility-associated C-terminal domain-containing protein [Bacteroidales bacterium]|nr:gliding motility-associated C-terminal domain-containing protein [Bacteroidales bacterium]MDY6348253.1 gliding motility-associated C-terminal domain-containing protein [Bacteroidales bacterium]